MSDVASKNTVLPSVNASSLSGNASSYQSGGKKIKNRGTRKPTKKSKSRSRSTKKCWWKFW